MTNIPGWRRRRAAPQDSPDQAAAIVPSSADAAEEVTPPTPPVGERSAIPSVNGAGYRPKAGLGLAVVGVGLFVLVGIFGWNKMMPKKAEVANSTVPSTGGTLPATGAEGTSFYRTQLMPPAAPPAPIPLPPLPVSDSERRLGLLPVPPAPPVSSSLVVPAIDRTVPSPSGQARPAPPAPPSPLDLRKGSSLIIYGQATASPTREKATNTFNPTDPGTEQLRQRGGGTVGPTSSLSPSLGSQPGLGTRPQGSGQTVAAAVSGIAGQATAALTTGATAARLTGGPAVARGTDRSLTLKNGEIIKCVQDFAFSSEVAGQIKCTSAKDTWSADGKTVLLDAGTEFYGEVKTDLQPGRSRLYAIWTHADTPKGVRVQLDSPAIDQLGRAGMDGEVDTHFWDRFSAAIFLSVVDDSLAMIAQQGRNSGGNGGTTVVYPQNSSNTARDSAAMVAEKNLDIPPTLRRNQGELINIYVKQDRYFGNVYELRKS